MSSRKQKPQTAPDRELKEKIIEPVVEQQAEIRVKRQQQQVLQPQQKSEFEEKEDAYKEFILKLKKYSKTSVGEVTTFSNNTEHRDKNLIFSSPCQTNSSSVDKLENYPYKGFPYKRGVKLAISEAEPFIHVEPTDDLNLYGICVDIDEFSQTATVLPITNNFSGYLVTRNPNIKIGDILDINTEGIIIKAGGGTPTIINAVALSDSFTLDFSGKLKEAPQSISEFKINFVKVAIYGNRGFEITIRNEEQ
ncbi:hypothetical protein DB313_06280 (plasmid) [Borrelia turcica IST7]|uniref:Uncharacterized protein n=1 Tax=Borrelia turcica IST7 TaxID=1104446 RepID=A0A386PRJ2_9SPIR|nr:DUF228 domain-containing protein [Borrelia turcica]AYE37107.1 hypothetical protein DB313_06280 [Borrelia turcica IST7]